MSAKVTGARSKCTVTPATMQIGQIGKMSYGGKECLVLRTWDGLVDLDNPRNVCGLGPRIWGVTRGRCWSQGKLWRLYPVS